MTDILDIRVNGMSAREADLTQFGSATALRQFQSDIREKWMDGGKSEFKENYFESTARLRDHFQRAIEAADQAAVDRQNDIEDRNLDVVVEIKSKDANPSFRNMTAAQVLSLIDCFDTAEQMTAYEFDAYETVGDAELDRQNVDTLYDLFGTRFATAFFKWKTQLLNRAELNDLYLERRSLDRKIAKLEAELAK